MRLALGCLVVIAVLLTTMFIPASAQGFSIKGVTC